MSRKLFKRLLITASLLSPIAIVTPIILTSCSNSNDINTDKPGGPTSPEEKLQ